MWDTNMFKDFDPFSYKKVKENLIAYNEKVINFWKDFYNDLFNNIKRDS